MRHGTASGPSSGSGRRPLAVEDVVVTPGGTVECPGPRASARRSRDEARSRSRRARIHDETSQSEITDVQDADHNSFEEEMDNTDRPPYIVRWNDEDWTGFA